MTTIERRKLGVTYYDEYQQQALHFCTAKKCSVNQHARDVEHEWNLPIRPADAVIFNHVISAHSHEKSAELYSAWDIRKSTL